MLHLFKNRLEIQLLAPTSMASWCRCAAATANNRTEGVEVQRSILLSLPKGQALVHADPPALCPRHMLLLYSKDQFVMRTVPPGTVLNDCMVYPLPLGTADAMPAIIGNLCFRVCRRYCCCKTPLRIGLANDSLSRPIFSHHHLHHLPNPPSPPLCCTRKRCRPRPKSPTLPPGFSCCATPPTLRRTK